MSVRLYVDLPLVVMSSEGVRTPDEARALGRPILLVINGIHGWCGEFLALPARLPSAAGIGI